MISLIAAISENNCIGKNGQIPWHIPEDLKRVKEYTLGKVIIMGKNTWDSLPPNRKPLPGRTNVVITRSPAKEFPPEVEVYNTVQQAITAHNTENIVGFGGAGIYQEMMPLAEELSISHVHQTIEDGTAFFPEINPQHWQEVERTKHIGYDVVLYKKIKSAE